MSRLLLLSMLAMGCGDSFAVSLGSNAQPELEMDEVVDAAMSMDMPDATPDEEEIEEEEESEDEEEEESGAEP